MNVKATTQNESESFVMNNVKATALTESKIWREKIVKATPQNESESGRYVKKNVKANLPKCNGIAWAQWCGIAYINGLKG